jgi:hypothetical protein
MAAGTVAGSVGVYGTGYVYDHFGGYSRAFYVVILLCALSFLILIALKPPVRQAECPGGGITVLNYHPIWHADFETGCARQHDVQFYADTYPGNPFGPDKFVIGRILWKLKSANSR